jgi:hypothetical protein
MGFSIDDYVDVAERLRMFKSVYPTGSLQQVDLKFIEFAGKSWVVYTAAAYRTPDDARPGHGTAWEPVPGTTSFKRDSEIMNCETSAWGRAVLAVLAADSKRIASKNEVVNRMPQNSPKTPVQDFLATAHLLYQNKDLEGLRGLYKTVKGTRGHDPELLQQITELANELKGSK